MAKQAGHSDNEESELPNTEDFPNNSLKAKIRATEEGSSAPLDDIQPKKKIKKVTRGRLLRKKKSIGSNLAQTFFGEDTKSVGSYILWDVLIPAAKNTIQEMVASGIEMLLFGETRVSGRRRDRDRDRSIVSYDRMHHSSRSRNDEPRRYARPSNRYDFDEIIFETGEEAADVLAGLEDLIKDYNQASVADFYELAGVPDSQWTDNKWGWDDLKRTRCLRVRNGYIIDLPRPIELSD